uniref:Uncharacterized protein n=1 Tax=Octopus bimaculoides TaxID=37653 RepID=A0A0L8HZS6_OCTBM
MNSDPIHFCVMETELVKEGHSSSDSMTDLLSVPKAFRNLLSMILSVLLTYSKELNGSLGVG